MLSQSHIRGLLSSFDFSEGTGTTLNDKSGNGNNATIVGGTWTTDRFGRSNRAILLDGADDYIDLGLASYQGDLSAIVSFKPITIEDVDPIITKGYKDATNYPPSFTTTLRSTAGSIRSFNGYSSGNVITLAATNSYVANVFNCQYVSFKRNVAGANGGAGVQNTTQSANVNTNWSTNRKILVGKYEDSAVRFSNIVVDRIMLFNRFLSGHELSKLANRLKIGDLDK